jgi:DNA polymerase-3 subunit delta
MPPLHALDFVDKPPAELPAVVVAHGDDAYLKQLVWHTLCDSLAAESDGDISASRFDGGDMEPATLWDQLSTASLFGGGRRMVAIEDADAFVTRHRSALEQYVAKPRKTGILVLEVNSWPANTRLAKSVAESGLPIECKAPGEAKLVKWLAARARKVHGAKLEADAAERLVEIVGPEVGLLEQELAKLAVTVPPGASVTTKDVERYAGGWRTQTVWQLLDTAAEGDAERALEYLDSLLAAGEHPVAILGQIGSSLRRFTAATRIVESAEGARQRPDLRRALQGAGFKPFVVAKAESQLRQLGRERAGALCGWLLEADLAIKGVNSSPPRARRVLEQLIVRMSRQAADIELATSG